VDGAVLVRDFELQKDDVTAITAEGRAAAHALARAL
jgi:hypothetical protein